MFYEQKYLELLHAGDMKNALHCLRRELGCLNHRAERVRELSGYLFNAADQLAEISQYESMLEARRALLRRIQPCVKTDVMMPEARLRQLLSQALHAQREKCLYVPLH